MWKSDSATRWTGSYPDGFLLRLLAASAVLLVAWSFVVPIFEAPDEIHHWAYARYLHDNQRLPPLSSALVDSTHPPLYYLLVAPFARDVAVPPSGIESLRNGTSRLICPPRFYENCYLDFLRYWPIRFGRLVSVFLSLTTVLFTYLAAREMTGHYYTGLLAGSLTLLLPQFTFRGTNISNDVGLTTMCAVTTYFVIRLFQRDFAWRTAWIASLSFILAFLCKVSAVIFAPVVVIALIYRAETWKAGLKRLSVLPISAILAAPWVIRNQIVYGDPLAINHISQDLPEIVTRRSLWSSYFLTTFPTESARSFVGVFGYMNLYLPSPIYWIFGVLAAVATAGLCWGLVRHKLNARLIGILVVLPVLAVASLIQFNLTFTQPQGRYLFAALPAIMLLAAAGLESLPHWNRRLTCALVMLLGVINIYALMGVEFRNYWMPQKDTILSTVGTSVSTDLMKLTAAPLIARGRLGQTFIAEKDNLSGVELQIATYAKTIPAGFVRLHLRSSPEDARDIASAVTPAITDCSFVKLNFPPLSGSKGKSYYVFLDSEGLPPGNMLTVFTSDADVYPAGHFMVNGKPTSFDTDFRISYATVRPACPACLLRGGESL
jgi:4-amino-4-deoxy-L-arabinose transferase-like glycosyltransferase